MQSQIEPRVEYAGLRALPGFLQASGSRRALLLTGGSTRHVASLELALEGWTIEVFDGARRHVPREVVDRAGLALRASGADTVISVGGGSATGLGKALRLADEFYFLAVPTTYAGSELTDLYGITTDGGKQTGRDPRVLPDLVLYDVDLTLDMPLVLSVTSLLNALAHPLSAISTGLLEGDSLERALVAASEVYRAAAGISVEPRDLSARRGALQGTVLAAQVLRRSAVGIHHKLAHALGGRFDLDHAGLHAVLLPHTLALLGVQSPELLAVVERRVSPELPRRVGELLARAGAPMSLADLGVSQQALRDFSAERPDLPAKLLDAAFVGAMSLERISCL